MDVNLELTGDPSGALKSLADAQAALDTVRDASTGITIHIEPGGEDAFVRKLMGCGPIYAYLVRHVAERLDILDDPDVAEYLKEAEKQSKRDRKYPE